MLRSVGETVQGEGACLAQVNQSSILASPTVPQHCQEWSLNSLGKKSQENALSTDGCAPQNKIKTKINSDGGSARLYYLKTSHPNTYSKALKLLDGQLKKNYTKPYSSKGDHTIDNEYVF